MCWSSRSAEQDVVAGDRRPGPGPSASRRRPGRARSRGHRCILSGTRRATGVMVEMGVRLAARLGQAVGSPGRRKRLDPGRSGGPTRRRPRRRSRLAPLRRRAGRGRSDPARLADERHRLTLDRIEAHPQGGRLLLGDLADVGRLLVGGHRPATDDALRLADHQPGEVVAVHAPPRRGQQVVRSLEPHLERGERRVRAQPVALVDQLAGAGDEVVTGHAGPSPAWIIASRSARARRVHGPGRHSRSRPRQTGDRQDPGYARAQERLVRRRQVRRREATLDRPEPDARTPAEQPRTGRPGQDRAIERRRRELGRPSPRAPDEEDVGRRALRQVIVDGQEERVVGARPARLEPGAT